MTHGETLTDTDDATTAGPLTTDHSRANLDGSHSHGSSDAPVASRADRPTSFNIADFAMPTGREEEWRFTPLERFSALFAEDLHGAAPTISDPQHSGVTVETVAMDDPRVGQTEAPGDRIAAAAWHSSQQATVITIDSQANADATVIEVRGHGSEPAAQHIVVIAETGTDATVVLNHLGMATVSQGIEIIVREDARLNFVSVQDWDDGATHASSQRMSIERGAFLKHTVVSLGGDVRICADMDFAGEGAEIESLGLYYTDAHQHHEHRLFAAHRVPNCKSRVTYKGALQGEGAHAVWIGDVLIGSKATGTDTYELNRNLVLTAGAIADSVPNLEIETGEIEGAGHASATGRFDDEHLFYLMSRGVPELEARRLVVLGFFGEIVNQIRVPVIEEHLMEVIERELVAGSGMDL